MGRLPEKNFITGAKKAALGRDGARCIAGRFPVEVELGHPFQWQFAHLIGLRLQILTFLFRLGQELQLVRERFGGIGGCGGLLMLFQAAVAPAKPDERGVGAPAQTTRQLGAFSAFHVVCFPTDYQCRQTPASGNRHRSSPALPGIIPGQTAWCSGVPGCARAKSYHKLLPLAVSGGSPKK
jgi:hypothetical protein